MTHDRKVFIVLAQASDMVHKLYIAVRKERGRTPYLVVLESTNWSGSACYSKGLSFGELSGYVRGASSATLGNMKVINGIPEERAKGLKMQGSTRLSPSLLDKLLMSSGI